jgi:hypothetical protein
MTTDSENDTAMHYSITSSEARNKKSKLNFPKTCSMRTLQKMMQLTGRFSFATLPELSCGPKYFFGNIPTHTFTSVQIVFSATMELTTAG